MNKTEMPADTLRDAEISAGWAPPRRRIIAYAVILTLLAQFTYHRIYDRRIFIGGDNAEYYALAESLATGQGYRELYSVGRPEHNHFPPGYPLLMAAMMKLGIKEAAPLTLLNGLFLWGALLLLFLLFHRWSGSPELALAAACLCLLNAHLLKYSTVMMSEVPYLFFLALALFAYCRLPGAGTARSRIAWMGLLVAAAVMLLYIRTAAIAVVAAIGLHLLVRRRALWAAIFLGVVALSQLPWRMRSISLGGDPYLKQVLLVNPYRPELGGMHAWDWLARLGGNIQRYTFHEVPGGMLPWTGRISGSLQPTAEEWMWPALLFPLMVFGLARMRKDRLLLALLLAASLSLLMCWPPVWSGVRFLLPLVPFLVFLACHGAYALAGLLAARARLPAWCAWAITAPVLLLCALHLWKHVLLEGPAMDRTHVRELAGQRTVVLDRERKVCFAPCVLALEADRNNPYPAGYKEYFAVAARVGKTLPGGDSTVVCCRKPALFHLFAHCLATSFPKTADPDSMVAFLRERRVTHVVVDQLGYADVDRYLVPVIEHDPLKFPVLWKEQGHADSTSATYLLGFRPELGYRGRWVLGGKQGLGEMHYPDGSVFRGWFENDTIHGDGVLSRRDGSEITGQWYAGQLHGHGRWTKDGRILLDGEWDHGRFVSGVDNRGR